MHAGEFITPMPRSKKTPSNWFECEACRASILHKDIEQHSGDCPPTLPNLSHYFIKNDTLYGTLDIKINAEMKQLAIQDKDHLVFLSQPAIQLCGFSMGQNVCIQDLNKTFPAYAKIVWPTVEKSLVSVLVTKNALDLSFEKAHLNVAVSKIVPPIKDACEIKLVGLGSSKMLDLTSEISNRIHKLHLDKLLTERNRIKIMFYGKVLKYEVKTIRCVEGTNSFVENLALEQNFNDLDISDAPRFCRVIDKTKWVLYGNEDEYIKSIKKDNLLPKIGGLDTEISDIREVMNVALGITPSISELIICRGVLLYGASGTGKTMVANALALESKCNVVRIGCVDETLNKLLADAIKYAPSVVVIDEIDLICPAKRANDSDKKTTAAILNLFESINESCIKVFVIATSNKPDSIDLSLRRCRRLDREIEIPTPNPKARLAILQKLLDDIPSDINHDELEDIANTAHGFVGSDLLSLCSRAALQATSRINVANLKYALTRISPSAMREVQVEVPNVKWSDIGGQDHLKLILRQAVEWPLKHPESFVRMGITPPRGVLMFGPPGCSKTMIAKALATESGLNFISIKGPELFSKWVGESERAVRDVFHKARQVAPSVIFFDEIDALGGERSANTSSTSVQERVLAQLLTELDGVTPLGDVTVLAATNRPDRIDKALLRPGRLDRIVYVPLPDADTRREIFNLKFRKMPIVGINVEELVRLTENYSGAEVNAVCHEAAMKALEESLDAEIIETRHFELALKMITPRTPSFLIKIYEDYIKQ